LHFSATGLSWVLNAYTLVFGGLLLLGGRTGDLFGRRRMFIVGVLLFAMASLAGGFAQDKGFLLAMRALQGVGGAIVSPTALSLVTTTFTEGPDRNRAFGVYSAVSGAGAAIGLLLGGILTDLLSWRYVLFVNAPIGIALAVLAPRYLEESERREAGSLDLPGAVLSTAGMGALVYGFIRAATDGWSATAAVVAFAAAGALLLIFILVESASANPLLPLRLFRVRARVGSYLVMLVLGAAVFAMFYFLTQYVQQVKGFSPLIAGVGFLPVSAVIIVAAQVASRILIRVGPQVLIMFGTVAAGFGLLFLSTLTPHSSYAGHVLPAIMLIALGMGCIFVPITVTSVGGVAPEDAGIASAMLNVGQMVGGTIGLSALVTVYGTATRHYRPKATSAVALQHAVFTHGADAAFKAGAIFAAFGLLVAILMIHVTPGAVAAEPSETIEA
jgi:EmrB/QacA subfamily drug resistance transporter